jgi:hypothetical protein
MDRSREYIMLVDGDELGRVRHGQDLTLTVPPGHHLVGLRIDWCRSEVLDIDLAAAEEVHLECRARPAWQALYWISLGRNRYIAIRRMGGAHR